MLVKAAQQAQKDYLRGKKELLELFKLEENKYARVWLPTQFQTVRKEEGISVGKVNETRTLADYLNILDNMGFARTFF